MIKQKKVVGVMGSAARDLEQAELYKKYAQELASEIVARDCVLLTGETSGIPKLVQLEVQKLNGTSIGISPAISKEDHILQMKQEPISDYVIYTGEGLLGRNLTNIRSSDIIIFFAGSVGTLNEFTIAYSEGKIIGIVEGSGGISDMIAPLIPELDKKKTGAKVFFDKSPGKLLAQCLI